METSPWNKKLHKYLMTKRYKYTQHYRYDRYDKGNITIFYYINNYIMILEGGEPASSRIVREIESVL
jgi:hypothetical protein